MKKNTIILIVVTILSIIMLYSLIQLLIHENYTVGNNFWLFIFDLSLIALGSYIIFIPMNLLVHQFKKADAFNVSKNEIRTFKTKLAIKFKYLIIILFYIAFFTAMGTILVEVAITLLFGPEIFPIALFSFLLISGLILTFFFSLILLFYEVKTRPYKENLKAIPK